jgi:predicted nuclease with TOPRIM domain
MANVNANLTALREAANRLNQSSHRIEQSVQNVQTIIDELVGIGFESPAATQFMTLYNSQRGVMSHWAEQLLSFSAKLNESANAIEQALADSQSSSHHHSHAGVPFIAAAAAPLIAAPLVETPPEPQWAQRQQWFPRADPMRPTRYSAGMEAPDAPEAKPPQVHELDEYVSDANRDVYNELQGKRQQLSMSRTELVNLMETRDERLEELRALRNRLVSFDRDIDVDGVPRVQALRHEITELNRRIADAQHGIGDLGNQVDELTTRLERVKPGPDADLNLIASLEHGETQDYIKERTEGCVNYIVSRMAIPDGIPGDAHLWNDNAEIFKQYGITSGTEPLVGSVLVMEREHSFADDIAGHIMYVERVENGQVWITDNNHMETPVLLSDLTDELSGPNLSYLYFPWQTHA